MKIKNTLVYTILAGLFLVPFVAFIVPGNMFFPFISGKGFAFRILIEVLFGLYAMLAVMVPEYRPKMSWITKAVGIFTVVILIADIFGANAFKSLWSNYERMEGFVLIIHLAMYYIVASSVLSTTSRWYRFFDISLVASVIMSFYGVLQIMGKIAINQGGVRLDATFGNAAYLAIYLVFHIFIALYLLCQNYQSQWKKWSYGVIAVFETCILYFTATRGAILGLIGGLILAAIIIAWKEKENQNLRKLARNTLIGIAILIVGFIALRNTSFVQKSPVMSRFAQLSATDLEAQGRFYVWPMAVKGFLEHPILGWGQESFNFVFNKFYDPRMYNQEQWFDRAHNIVLDWLVAGGLLGFLSYVGLYVAMFYYIWRKESSMTVVEKSLLIGMISAYIFNNMFVFDNLLSYILFFAVLAYVHTRSTLRDRPTGNFYTKVFSRETAQYVLLPVIGVVTIAVVYFVNVPAVEANITLIQALSPQSTGGVEQNLALFKKAFAYNSFGSSEALEQLISVDTQIVSSTQVPDTTKQEFYDFTKTEIEKKIASTPHDARYLAFAGSFFDAFGQYDLAQGYLKQAVIESPKKQSIYFELGTSYIGSKDYSDAFTVLQQAYTLETDSPDAQIMYAVGAIYTKNASVLEDILSKIPQSTLVTDNRILQAYAGIGDYQSVIAILTARLQTDPTNMQDQLSLASAYLQIGQKQKAIDIINAMEKADPTFKTQGDQYIQEINNS